VELEALVLELLGELEELPELLLADEPPAAPVADPVALEELLLVDAFVVPFAETVSPTSPESATIVAVLRRVELAVSDGPLVALDRQLVALDGRFRRGEVGFARGRADARARRGRADVELGAELLPWPAPPVEEPLVFEAVEVVLAAAAAALAPLEPCSEEDSPLLSSSLARLASADSRLAFACSSVTSALCGSSAASS